jgi:hypothetical protein
VIKTAEDPDAPGDERAKRDAIEWANTGLAMLRNATWVADKIKDAFT